MRKYNAKAQLKIEQNTRIIKTIMIGMILVGLAINVIAYLI
jgi:hypothetical protein